MQELTSLTIDFGGTKPNLWSYHCKNQSTDCQPIRTKSRRFNRTEQRFITEEISKLPLEGIIELSSSPWCS